MENVLFLDIDGVLNSTLWDQTHQTEIKNSILIDQEKVRLFASLIRRTDAQVILHSGWRFWYDDGMRPLRKETEVLSDMLTQEGISLLGKTPDLTTEEIRATKMFSKIKADEILLWLDTQETAVNWIVLEDRDLHNATVSARQIKTDTTTGLTADDVEAAVRLFRQANDR